MSISYARLSILVVAIAFAMSASGQPANAQIDPNIQVRLDTFIPRPDVRVRPPETERVQVQRRETVVVTEETPIPLAQQRALLTRSQKAQGIESLLDISKLPVATQKAILRDNKIPDSIKRQVKKTRVVTKTVVQPKPPITEVILSGSGNFLYDTNATKSNRNRIADGSFADSNLLYINIPVGADTISLSSGLAVQRYMTLIGRSSDVVVGDAIYKKFLGATLGPGGARLTTTSDGVSFGVITRTVYQPGLSNHQLSLVTPSAAWSRSNIPLGNEINGTGADQAYRYFASIVASVGYTLSDVATQENLSARTALTVGWRTPITGLTLTATGIVQGRHYTSFPGRREDLYLEANGAVTWQKDNVALSGLMTFAHQESSQRALIWTGFTASPQVRLDIKLN